MYFCIYAYSYEGCSHNSTSYYMSIYMYIDMHIGCYTVHVIVTLVGYATLDIVVTHACHSEICLLANNVLPTNYSQAGRFFVGVFLYVI